MVEQQVWFPGYFWCYLVSVFECYTIHIPFWFLIANAIEVGFNAGMSINSKWCGNFMCVSRAGSCLSSAPHSLSWRRWYYHTCIVWLESGPELEWPAPCSCGCLPLYILYMNFLQSHSVMHLWCQNVVMESLNFNTWLVKVILLDFLTY